MTRPGGAERAEAILAGAREVYVSAVAAEIPDASALFRRAGMRDACVTGIFSPLVNHASYVDTDNRIGVRSFFLTRALKQQLDGGLVAYCPWRYSEIDRWMSAPGRFDAAMIMVSPPDARGRCSLGVQSDFFPGIAGKVENLIGVINPDMPHTHGDAELDYRTLTAVIETDAPLATIALRPADEAVERIATAIAGLVQDEATLQFGIGQIPSEVIARLDGHRRLRVHSGVIDDHILRLGASGALDPDHSVVTGTAVGTRDLYGALADPARFRFRSVAHTHSHATLSAIPCFTAVNSVLQADLFGQVSAETSEGRLVASPGGLPDFVRGALASPGGQSIIALRARGVNGRAGGVTPVLAAPSVVTCGSTDADIIVTEFGVARIRNLSMDARARALIAVAAPEDREALSREWARLKTIFVPR